MDSMSSWEARAVTRKSRVPRNVSFPSVPPVIAGTPRFNAPIHPGESIRVFPLSNWTESDIWEYIAEENIEIVNLYFAAPRPVVRRNGQWIMVDDDRFPLG